MNYKYIISIIFLLILLLIIYNCPCNEKFSNRKKKQKKIKLGMLENTPEPLKKIIIQLQSVGSQLSEDTRYDKVAKDYLDPKKIK